METRRYYPGSCNYMAPVIVAADGSLLLAPHGWSSRKTATGKYELTHNLGRTNYIPVNGPIAGGDYRTTSSVLEANANNLLVESHNGPTLTDGGFMLLIMGV